MKPIFNIIIIIILLSILLLYYNDTCIIISRLIYINIYIGLYIII